MDSPGVGRSVDGLVVFGVIPVRFGGSEPDMNRGGGPQELLDAVDHSSSLTALTAYFGGRRRPGPVADGPFGALHVGTGGAPADDQALGSGGWDPRKVIWYWSPCLICPCKKR